MPDTVPIADYWELREIAGKAITELTSLAYDADMASISDISKAILVDVDELQTGLNSLDHRHRPPLWAEGRFA